MEKTIKEALTESVVLEAANRYQIDRKAVRYLGGFENFVYEFERDNHHYIMRFVHSIHRSYDLVLAELEFIEYLHQNGASVSLVVHSASNQKVEKIDDEFGGYFTVAVFQKAKGSLVKKDTIDSAFNFEFGKEVGLLHRLAKQFQPVKKRYHWHEDDYLDIARRNIAEEDRYMIDECIQLIQQIQSYPVDENSYGLIHYDLHFGNMFYDDVEKFTFFDWDDCAYMHFISDIAIIIFYQFGLTNLTDTEIEDRTNLFLKDFMKGYQTEHSLDPIWFERLNDFLKLREYILYFAIHAAGEDVIQSDFGTFFLRKFKPRIQNHTPFFDIKRITF